MSTTVKRTFKGRRPLAATAALLAAGAAFPAQAAWAEEPAGEPRAACVFEKLPIPEGLEFTFTTGMSDDGSVIAYRAYPLDANGDWERFPFLYADGEATAIPLEGQDQVIADVNSSGTAAASTYLDEGQVPYVWSDGELTRLNGGNGEANGINENGDIVGGLLGEVDLYPVVWPKGAAKPTELPMPDNAAWGSAVGIDEEGTIVGLYSDAETGDFKSYVWYADGTAAELPMPDGIDPATAHSYPTDIKGDWVSGYLNTPDGGVTGVRWNLADGTAEDLQLDNARSIALDGTAAGSVEPAAAVQSGDEVTELPGVVDPADNWFGDTVDAISADGSVLAGHVYTGENEFGHVLNSGIWTCE